MMMMSAVLSSSNSVVKPASEASPTTSLSTFKTYRRGYANAFSTPPSSQHQVDTLFAQALASDASLATIEQALVHLAPNAKQLLPYLASPHTAQVSLATMAVLRLGYRYEVQQWLQQSSSVSLWVRQFLSHQFSLSA
ncbi:MAG: hypothetical protein ACKO34_05125 [Vampirovibrionales bacterium]